MTKLLIGSRALEYWFGSIDIKPSTDFDVISESPIEGCEFHDIKFLNNADVEKYSTSATYLLPDGSYANVVKPLGLALIKRSHLWRDLSFPKHITHYHKVLGAYRVWSNEDIQFLNTRIELTKQAFPQGHPNLMQSKDDFFDDAVVKKYQHDDLHEMFAFYDKPLYTRLLRNENLAWCEEDKWNTLSYDEKCKCVAEEVYVIATERLLIPFKNKYPYKIAFFKALQKVCTTLCSGWFRDFAIDNYPEIVAQYDHFKFQEVLTKLGEI